MAKEEVRPITRNPSTWASALRISSVMPSEKYSCSLSELRLRNGSTAMERRAGAPGAVAGSTARWRAGAGQTKK